MNEPEYVFDGEKLYKKVEYMNVVYPQLKSRSKEAIITAKNSMGFRHEVEVEEWANMLIMGIVPETEKQGIRYKNGRFR